MAAAARRAGEGALAILVIAAAAGARGPAVAAEGAPPVAVRCGTLLEPADRTVVRGAVVLIEGEKVVAAGAAVRIPDGARVIDLGGMTCLPGMIDAHTHLLLQGDATAADYDAQLLHESMPYRALRAARAARLSLEHGFTTLRDIGNEGAGFVDSDLKRAQAAGVMEGPRLFIASKALAPTGAYPLSDLAWELPPLKGVELCDGPWDCRRAVRSHLERGADWIKVYVDRSYFKDARGGWASRPNFTAEELAAIVDETHRQGKKVAAHSMTPTGHALALGAGVDSIEHGDVLPPDVARTMAEKGVFLCPTITVTRFVAGPRSKTNPIWLELMEEGRKSFRNALEAGVPIALGTDAGGFDWDKVNQAEELRWMVDYGMTSWQALQSATVVAARLLGQEGSLGTLRQGAWADLIAVDGDPLADIGVLERVGFVMQAGRVVREAGK